MIGRLESVIDERTRERDAAVEALQTLDKATEAAKAEQSLAKGKKY